MSAFQMLSPSVPMVGPDGRLAREWYLFLTNLWQSNGGGQNAITQDQLEALLLAASRVPTTTAIEHALQELVTVLQSQRSEHATIQALERRISALEDLVQTLRGPVSDLRVGELQTITFGSRSWL